MESIGKIKNREIFYISIRDNLEWQNLLPTEKWVAFTIADHEDKEMLYDCTIGILNKNVTYTCSAGKLASMTEDYFDEEIGWRGVQHEEKTGEKFDFDKSPMTSMHRNFSEGFWFSAVVASDGKKEMNKVVCIDFTTRKVKKYLTELVKKINNGWFPSDEEIELVEYDN